MVITSDGRWMYVGSLVDGTIKAYRIESDGALTLIPEATVVVGQQVVGMALTPDGERLFITAGATNTTVMSYTVLDDNHLAPTGATPLIIPDSLFWALPAISANGRFLYVQDWRANRLTSYRIAPDSGLTEIGEPIPGGGGPAYPTLSPDGRSMYVSDEDGGTVTGYRVGRDGVLEPLPGSPYPAGQSPHSTAITASGERMYVPDALGGAVSGFDVQRDGSLRPMPGSPFQANGDGALLGRAVLSHDDEHLFVVQAIGLLSTSKVVRYDVRPDGSLRLSPREPFDTGVVFSDGPSAHLSPNQGPQAEIVLVSRRKRTVTLSARDSSDTDGDVSRYHWDLGDGYRITTRTARLTHTYAAAGTRTVSVRVEDDEGCSRKPLFTGLMISCNGGRGAINRVAVQVR